MKIIVAARETDFRMASQLLLSEMPNVDVVGTASTVAGLLALLKTYRVGIVILNQDLLRKSPNELIQKIKKSKSSPKVILISSEELPPQAVSDLGVDAIVNKTEPPDRLVDTFIRLTTGINPKSNLEKENSES